MSFADFDYGFSEEAQPRSQVSEDESESLELGQTVLLPRNSRKNRGGRRKSAFWVYFIMDNRASKARADATCTGCKTCLPNAQPMKDLVPHLMQCKKIDPLVRARAAKEYKQHQDKRRRHRLPKHKSIVLEPDSDDEHPSTEFVPRQQSQQRDSNSSSQKCFTSV
ncbi:hypothetical protein PINS_up006582 [Pythium insidiosum]|nr:hypothetical protein PINS_up006582 [Pythium insidiosum]